MVYHRDNVARALLDLGAKENVPLSELVSFRVGGPAAALLQPREEWVLCRALNLCRDEHIPVILLGNGTNVLPSDEGFSGLILQMSGDDAAPVFEGTKVTAGAGCSLTALAKESIQRGLMGLERLCGIPGTLGGAVAMNAGAYGGEIKSVLSRVRCYRDGTFVWEDARLDDMGYRKSPYAWPKTVVTAVELELQPDDGTAAATMADCMKKRREKQPLSLPSAGSTFKRPEGHFAGALIEGCGLKGYSIGGAQVSELHAGFIVNRGGATAGDVEALMRYVQDVVYAETGVHLEPEVKRLEELLCIF